MRQEISELIQYRELLLMIAYRDVRIKYKQSVMGLLWAILMPSLVVLAGVLVRYGYSLAIHRPLLAEDVASVAVKALPWAFVVSSLRFASASLISNATLVTKIYFPKEIFPLAAVLSNLFDLAVASLALVVVLALAGTGVSAELVWVPLLLGVLVFQVCGISLIVSAASLFFRDVKYIVEVILTFGIFFTPVLYDVDMFGRVGSYLLLNPIAPVLEGLHDAIVQQRPPQLSWMLYAGAFGFVALAGGYGFFKRLEPAFAESI
jgi:homopolymeric O-antigen transport system permease protein